MRDRSVLKETGKRVGCHHFDPERSLYILPAAYGDAARERSAGGSLDAFISHIRPMASDGSPRPIQDEAA